MSNQTPLPTQKINLLNPNSTGSNKQVPSNIEGLQEFFGPKPPLPPPMPRLARSTNSMQAKEREQDTVVSAFPMPEQGNPQFDDDSGLLPVAETTKEMTESELILSIAGIALPDDSDEVQTNENSFLLTEAETRLVLSSPNIPTTAMEEIDSSHLDFIETQGEIQESQATASRSIPVGPLVALKLESIQERIFTPITSPTASETAPQSKYFPLRTPMTATQKIALPSQIPTEVDRVVSYNTKSIFTKLGWILLIFLAGLSIGFLCSELIVHFRNSNSPEQAQ